MGGCPRVSAGAESSFCFETLLQACIRREFPSSRKRGLSGDREGLIHVAAIPWRSIRQRLRPGRRFGVNTLGRIVGISDKWPQNVPVGFTSARWALYVQVNNFRLSVIRAQSAPERSGKEQDI